MSDPYDTPLILATNINALMRANPALSSNLKIQKASDGAVPKTTVGRVRSKKSACDIRTLANLAKLFGLEPWQLLAPEFDVRNPPVLRKPTASEAALYAKLEALIHDAKAGTE